MSTNTRESQEILRLFKCVVDTGTDVLAAFAKVKLLPTFNGNFKQFLEDKKHEIFHLWQSKKLSCCECPPAGYNLKRKSHMDNWIFKKIYDDSGLEDRGHIIRNSGNVVQVCLHKYVTRNIAIDELDISVISFLLRNLTVLSQNETTSLDTITTTRSQICHAYSMNCFPLIFLNTAWTALENALVDLADPSYKGMTRKQIKYLRKVDLEKEEITELTKNVEELNTVLHEISDMQKANNGIIKNGFTTCQNQIIQATKEINKNTDIKLAEIKGEIQQLRATINILIEQNPRRTKSPNTNINEHKESSLYNMEMSSEEMYDRNEARPKRKPEGIRQFRATCHVEGGELDEQSAVQSLSENKHSFSSDFGFNIVTAEQKCLLLELEAASRILEDTNSFRMALRALLIQIARAGKIDINKPSTITVRLIFKDEITEDDIKVIKEISGQLFNSNRIDASLTYPAVAVPYDTRGENMVNIDGNCRKCKILQTEVIVQRITVRMLEFKNRELTFSTIELELLDKWKDREISKLALKNRHLREMIHETAPTSITIDRQQEKQYSVGGNLKAEEATAPNKNTGNLKAEETTGNLKAEEATGLNEDTDNFFTDFMILHSDKDTNEAHAYQKLLMEHIDEPHLKVDLATSESPLLSTMFNTDNFCTDIMIIHSDKDTNEAHACQKLLMEHIDVPHLKVDLATSGSPLLSTMFNTCRLVFIFHTINFETVPKASIKNLVYGLLSFKDPQRIIPLEVDEAIGTQPVMTLGYVKEINDKQFPIFQRKVEKLVEYWRRVLQ